MDIKVTTDFCRGGSEERAKVFRMEPSRALNATNYMKTVFSIKQF